MRIIRYKKKVESIVNFGPGEYYDVNVIWNEFYGWTHGLNMGD